MGRTTDIPLEEIDAEVQRRFTAARRTDALPLMQIPWHLSSPSTTPLIALAATVRREQIWRMRENVRKQMRPEWKAFEKVNNQSRKLRRGELVKKRFADPVLGPKLRKAAVESFKRNKKQVYAYRNNRRATNPQFRVSSNLRTYLYQKVGMKRGSESRFKKLVGCSTEELVAHLEKHFLPGMTWQNYGRGHGKWTIDHTRPCASFPDLTDEAQQRECFHFSNMRPMWFVDNILKSDSWDCQTAQTAA